MKVNQISGILGLRRPEAWRQNLRDFSDPLPPPPFFIPLFLYQYSLKLREQWILNKETEGASAESLIRLILLLLQPHERQKRYSIRRAVRVFLLTHATQLANCLVRSYLRYIMYLEQLAIELSKKELRAAAKRYIIEIKNKYLLHMNAKQLRLLKMPILALLRQVISRWHRLLV